MTIPQSHGGALGRYRMMLAATTAIGTLIAAPAAAQDLPTGGTTAVFDPSNLGAAATIGPNIGGNQLNVLLNSKNTVIDWATFNIAEGKTVDFNTLRAGPVAVLNRVAATGGASSLDGNLTSRPNVSVWLINPNGILVGGTARINTGSFVLSTLDMTNQNFLDGNYALTGTDTSGGISVEQGAQIAVSTGSGSSRQGLVLVAPVIDAHGTFNAGAEGDENAQDVAFVTATDVKLAYGADNGPLSVTINRGTPVSGRSQFVRGTVRGRDAIFALASQETVTDALLQVDANVTTARSGTRGIVLSAGAVTPAAAGVTVTNAPETAGIVGLTVIGNLKTDASNDSDVRASATGAMAFTGTLTSARDISLLGVGGYAATVSGNVAAGRGYAVQGGQVTLGNATQGASAVVQKAGGAVDITGPFGINGVGALTLQSDSNGSGNEALTMTVDGFAGFPGLGSDINFGPQTVLRGGTNQQAAVRLRFGSTAGSLTLGTVTARALVGATDSVGDFTNAIFRDGAITTGNISIIDPLAFSGASLTTGNLTSREGSITLTGTAGAVEVKNVDADDALSITSAGTLGTGAVLSGGDFVADAAGGATIGGAVESDGDLRIRAAFIRLANVNATSGGTIDLNAQVDGITSVAGLNLSSTSTQADDFIRLQASGPQGIDLSNTSTITGGSDRQLRVGVSNAGDGAPLVLGNVRARGLVGLAGLNEIPTAGIGVFSSGSLNFGTLSLIESFSARSVGGNISIGSVTVDGTNQGIALSAALGALDFRTQSTISASGDVSLISRDALTLDGVVSTNGSAAVSSANEIDLDRLSGRTGAQASGTSVNIVEVTGGPISLSASAGNMALTRLTGDGINLSAVGGTLNVLGDVRSTAGVQATSDGNMTLSGIVIAGGPVSLSANAGTVTLNDAITAAGDYTVTGQEVRLVGAQRATGAVTITSTAGRIEAIPGRAQVILAADTDNNGAEAITLSATGGGVALRNSVISAGAAGRSDVSIAADTGAIAIGNVNARSLTLSGSTTPPTSIETGNITLTQGFSAIARNGVSTGSIAVENGGVTIDGGSGAVAVSGAISSNTAVALTGSSVTASAITGGRADLTATTGNVASGNITVSGPVTALATAGTIDLGAVTATGVGADVILTALGALTVDGVNADGAATLTNSAAGANIVINNGLEAEGNVIVTTGGSILAPSLISNAGTLTVSAPNGSVTDIDGGGTILEAGPGKLLSLTVGDVVSLDRISGGPIAITASGITVGEVAAGTDAVTLTATLGALTINGNVTAGDTALSAAGAISLRSVAASGALALNAGGGLSFTDLAGATVTATAGGGINGGSANAIGALSLSARDGDATLGMLNAGGTIAVSASGLTTVSGAVDAGGSYSVTGAGVVLGSQPVTQKAAGPITITATSGDITGASGLILVNDAASVAGDAVIQLRSAGAIALGGSTVRTGALGLQADAGRAVTLGTIDADMIGGLAVARDPVLASFEHSGPVTTGDITTRDIAISLSSGDLVTGVINGTGQIRLAAAQGAITTQAITGSAVTLAASGLLRTEVIDSTGAVSASGSNIEVDSAKGSAITMRTAGALSGRSGGRAVLNATGGDLVVEAGSARMASLDAAGGVSITANTIDTAGAINAGRQVTMKSAGALTLSNVKAGTDLSLESIGAVTTGVLNAGGAIAVTGNGIVIDAADVGGRLALTSTGDVQLDQGSAAAATISATGRAVLGALSAGRSLTVKAIDVELNGIQRANEVMFQNAAPATVAMRIGDATGGDGFRLSNAEIALIQAGMLGFDQDTGTLQIGNVTFGAASGSSSVDLLTTGLVAVDGTVNGAGVGRNFTIGGRQNSGLASDIRVTATPGAGGRLLFNDANLELRGSRIAVGLSPGFLAALPVGQAGTAQALNFINNGNSPLYNAALGGAIYDPNATTTVSARSLTVRFADYALFQNTGLPGRFSGVVLGGTVTAPVAPALTASTTGTPGQSAFALFGTINVVGGPSAALLGPNVIVIGPRLLSTSRINGCLAGSGQGCLATIIVQPTLEVFSWDSEDVFGIARDVSTSFAPMVGGNNEELLTGLPALAPARDEESVGELGEAMLAPPPAPTQPPIQRPAQGGDDKQ